MSISQFHLFKAFFTSLLALLNPTLSHLHHGQGSPERLSDRPGVLQPFQSRAGAGLLGLGTLVIFSPRLCPSALPHPSLLGGVGHPEACPLAHPWAGMGFGGGCPQETPSLGLMGDLVPEPPPMAIQGVLTCLPSPSCPIPRRRGIKIYGSGKCGLCPRVLLMSLQLGGWRERA